MASEVSERGIRRVLALDLGTTGVRAAIAHMEGEDTTLLGFGETKFHAQEAQGGFTQDIAKAVELAHEAIFTARKQAGREPEACIIGFSGESIKGHTVEIDFIREHPKEEITLSELKHIVHQVQWSAFDRIRKDFAQSTGHLEIDIRLISASIEHITIDGQFIVNPLGFKGEHLKLDVYNCFAPLIHYGALQTIGAELPYPVLDIVAHPYSLSHAMIRRGEDKCLIVDIGAGSTDIAYVDEGLKETKSFALGGRTFTKRLSFELSISFLEAEKVKRAYTEGKLDSASSKIVSDIMARDAKMWLTGLRICLEELGKKSLPSKIFLTGGSSVLPEIEKMLRGRKWHQALPFTNYPQFSYMTPKEIPAFKDPMDQVFGVEHAAVIALCSLSKESLGRDAQVSSILRKMIQAEK